MVQSYSSRLRYNYVTFQSRKCPAVVELALIHCDYNHEKVKMFNKLENIKNVVLLYLTNNLFGLHCMSAWVFLGFRLMGMCLRDIVLLEGVS